MGAYLSTAPPPPKPNVDLLPPRFSPLPSHRDELPFSPLFRGFGAQSRADLFTRHFAARGAFLQGSFRPAPDAEGADVRVKVGAAVPLPAAYSGGSGAPEPRDFAASVAARLLMRPAPLAEPLLGQLRLSLSGGGGLHGVGSVGDASGGTGGYLFLPLDAMLQQGAEGRVLVGTGGAAAAPAAAAPAAAAGGAALPEVGLRVSRGDWSAGGHLGAGFPYPFRAWALFGGGGEGSGSVSAGVEVSGASAASLLRVASSPLSAAAAPSPPPPPPPPRRAGELALGAALALKRPLFEMSLAVDGARGYDVVAGYTQSFVVRRAVYNPLEEGRVKGVYQHVDLGVEARKALRPPFAASLDLAAAWQLNRCVLLKARLGTQRDAAVTLALRTWTEPSVVLCLTGSLSGSGEPGVGLSLALAGGAEREYRAAPLGQQRAAPTLLVPAKEYLNEKRREV
jgi:hypothetical protein